MVEIIRLSANEDPEHGVVWRHYMAAENEGIRARLYHYPETEEERAGWYVMFDGPSVPETWTRAGSGVNDLGDGERYIAQTFAEILSELGAVRPWRG